MNMKYGFLTFLLLLGVTVSSAQMVSVDAARCENLNTLEWRIHPVDGIADVGPVIATPGYDDSSWLKGRVPGTVLTSYVEAGLYPDPYFGDNQLRIPDGFFTADFWYRAEFELPESFDGRRVWLNLDGINWKADVYLNGDMITFIEGAFIRTRKDVTRYIKSNGPNVIAVRIVRNDNPGEVTVQHLDDPDPNGGVIGKDSPTFMASIGWNWMPTIPGRNIGIWNDVYLTSTGDVSVLDPFVRTTLSLPDTTKACLALDVDLKNRSKQPVEGVLEASFEGRLIEVPVTLAGRETKSVHLSSDDFPQLVMDNPSLWWPNGYGDQPMYGMKVSFRTGDEVSDSRDVRFGVRQYSYSVENDVLRLKVNGVPVLVRGGNWGMSDSMLRCDSLGYDLRVRLHKDMNLNMIRNWTGMIGDDEFYQACDRYGIMVWDDFWLANPLDGPDPTDEAMFIRCVEDKVRHFRNHPSVALWCGRNEGYPPARLDSAMRILTSRLDGSRYYISHSAASPVTGLGPYENKSSRWYYANRGRTLHSEQGIVVPPTVESMKAMMPEDKLWPINDMWGMHDWTQTRVAYYMDDMRRCFGEPQSIEDFCRKAQMLNMEACKSLMESWQSQRGSGVLVWMSQPSWPSMICQTYDWYFEPTAAFFAFRTACEQVHVLWRPDTEAVQVVNNTARSYEGMSADVKIVDIDGKLLHQARYPVVLHPDDMVEVTRLDFSGIDSPVCFIDLELTDAAGNVVSRNFYWRGREYMDYNAMNSMKEAVPSVTVGKKVSDGRIVLDCTVSNETDSPMVNLRLLVLDARTGERVLPVDYEDNYISLIPGRERKIKVSFDSSSCKSGRYELYIEGWNVPRTKIK